MVDTRYITHDKWTSLTATQVTYPNGRQVASGYDALYRRNGVTETTGGASIAAWQFFGDRIATVVLGNGITTSFMNDAQANSAVQSSVSLPAWGDNTTDRLGYDGAGRLIAKRFLPSGSTSSLVGFTTEYDPSSDKLFERALNAESRSALYPSNDSMDRLLEYQRGTLASGGGSVATPITLPGTDSQRAYDLDGLGNWKNTVYTPEGAGTPTMEIRQHNKLNEVTQVATTPVLYDHGNHATNPNPLIAQRGNGNITDDGTRVYAYDALNRLTTVTRKSDSAQVAAYTYDALGRRVQKIITNGGNPGGIANVTYRYLSDGEQIVEELLVNGTTSTLRQFVWGQYIDELIQLNIPANNTIPPLTAGKYYPLQDLLYRTAATTDSTGAIKEAYDYDVYGNTLTFNATGTGGNWWADDAITTLQPICEFLFTGRQYDPETEIYFYRARYYLPKLGRFQRRDVIIFLDFSSLYEYVSGKPISFTDPLGLDTTFSGEGHAQIKIGAGADAKDVVVGVKLSKDDGIYLVAQSPGYPCQKCDWIQFVHRIVDNPDPKVHYVFRNKNRDTYDNTTDPKNPKYRTDNNKPGSAFASKEYAGTQRDDAKQKLTFRDTPVFDVQGKAEHAIFDSFLYCDGKVVYLVHWQKDKTAAGQVSFSDISGKPATQLPQWAKDTLKNDGLPDPT